MPVPALIATEMLAVLEVRLSCASRMRTVGAGVTAEAETAFDGCWPKATFAGTPAWYPTPAVWVTSVPVAVAE